VLKTMTKASIIINFKSSAQKHYYLFKKNLISRIF
jgi:hypothetical protein